MLRCAAVPVLLLATLSLGAGAAAVSAAADQGWSAITARPDDQGWSAITADGARRVAVDGPAPDQGWS
ncbi:hypothetical protein [Streptomyces sp. NPDC002889]|uniref:hypothetical protein n=1 Tax=Streptomyces sp. NPDC002889 TaxID=3364669 RepID=UPI00368C5662